MKHVFLLLVFSLSLAGIIFFGIWPWSMLTIFNSPAHEHEFGTFAVMAIPMLLASLVLVIVTGRSLMRKSKAE